MRRLRANLPRPSRISYPLLILYALFALLSSPFPGAAPGKSGAGSARKAGDPVPRQWESGLAGNLSFAGEAWSDDDVDACHSSPGNRQSDGISAFALLDSEFTVRKAAAGASGMAIDFRHRFDGHACPIGVLHARAKDSYDGPALRFPHPWPSFLICDLPPPLPS